jgi:hypothetical protein
MRAIVFLFCLLGFAVRAAENSPRTCRIVFPSAPQDAPGKLHLFDGEASQEVELPQWNFSPVYKVRPGAVTLALLPAAPPAPAAPGAAIPIPAGAPKVAIGEGIGDFYLIVSSDPSNKVAPVKMQVINADSSKFKRGQMLWCNLTRNRVGGKVGSRNLLIEPNSRLILDSPATRMEDYHVNIRYILPGKEQSEPVCETNWPYDPRTRGVFFIVNPPAGLVPRIMGFSDFREAAE